MARRTRRPRPRGTRVVPDRKKVKRSSGSCRSDQWFRKPTEQEVILRAFLIPGNNRG